ncbi:MAG: cysteine desulfurase family protein [Methanomassiliicoccales archaeon]|jgi:cysteine desulfurase|nr:cysteine desulfurase family protein [Methanomassiliicoccales archaeon]
MVYMDYASSSPVDPRVIETMIPYFSEKHGNPSSVHQVGRESFEALEDSRKKIASLVNAERADEIVFTSGATESINLAIKGIAFRQANRGKHIITSAAEHISTINILKFLSTKGFKITFLPVDEFGFVDPVAVNDAITKETVLISIGYANGEVGSIQNIGEIGKIARDHGASFHVDAVAAIGKLNIDVRKEFIDLLSFSSNDIYGPKGVGALYIRKGTKIEPAIHGGGQERGLRSGTENLPGIVGFGKAAEIAMREMEAETERLTRLRDKLIEGILEKTEKAWLNGHPSKRISSNANFRFKYIEGESLVLRLSDFGIAAATSSACTSKTLEPSHVLLAMGVPAADAQGSLLLTMGRWTRAEEVEYVIENVPAAVDFLRKLSPLVPQQEV